MDNDPRIIIDDKGITARDLGANKILWKDIKDVNLVSINRGGYVITLELFDVTKYATQTNNLFGLKTFTIRIAGLDISPQSIYTEVVEHIR